MSLLLLLLVAGALAYFNGANDNIKGAATLVGSGLLSPRRALAWATAATAAGGLLSILFAGSLLAAFGGRGLVPDALAGSVELLLPAGLAAAATVALATRLHLPISTTHALVGGLLGVAAVAAPEQLRLLAALGVLAAPLLLVPLLAIALALGLIPLLQRLQRRLSPLPTLCLCAEPPAPYLDGGATARRIALSTGKSPPSRWPLACSAAPHRACWWCWRWRPAGCSPVTGLPIPWLGGSPGWRRWKASAAIWSPPA